MFIDPNVDRLTKLRQERNVDNLSLHIPLLTELDRI